MPTPSCVTNGRTILFQNFPLFLFCCVPIHLFLFQFFFFFKIDIVIRGVAQVMIQALPACRQHKRICGAIQTRLVRFRHALRRDRAGTCLSVRLHTGNRPRDPVFNHSNNDSCVAIANPQKEERRICDRAFNVFLSFFLKRKTNYTKRDCVHSTSFSCLPNEFLYTHRQIDYEIRSNYVGSVVPFPILCRLLKRQ